MKKSKSVSGFNDRFSFDGSSSCSISEDVEGVEVVVASDV